MMVVRPIRLDDLEQLVELANLAGPGLSTLVPEREYLENRIHGSLRAFRQIGNKPLGETYLFVMEDSDQNRLIGTCGVASKIGGFEPFYSYRIETENTSSESLKTHKSIKILRPVMEYNGPSLIGTLFIRSEQRRKGWGYLLACSRFLFIAEFRNCFEDLFIAELRGFIDAQGRSPFWDALGSKFFEIDFMEADRLCVTSKAFIADLFPKHPIYVALLPEDAQKVIGLPHDQTQPALKRLEKEGFQRNGLIDIFDAGPVVSCRRDHIKTVSEAQRMTVLEVCKTANEGSRVLIGNTRSDFRACLAPVSVRPAGVVIDRATATALDVSKGDPVRFVIKD